MGTPKLRDPVTVRGAIDHRPVLFRSTVCHVLKDRFVANGVPGDSPRFEDEGITWCRNWEGDDVQALLAVEALATK